MRVYARMLWWRLAAAAAMLALVASLCVVTAPKSGVKLVANAGDCGELIALAAIPGAAGIVAGGLLKTWDCGSWLGNLNISYMCWLSRKPGIWGDPSRRIIRGITHGEISTC